MTFTHKQVKTMPAESTSPDFESLFQEHWNRVCGVMYRLVGDWAEAEDLALDAFWQLYRCPPRDASNLGGWLYRVATRLGFNALRSRRRRQHYELESGYQVLDMDTHDDPAQALEQAQERQRVRATLGCMKPRSAELLILRHSGLSYREIATALGIAPGSVGTLLSRAEREFEQSYQEQGLLEEVEDAPN